MQSKCKNCSDMHCTTFHGVQNNILPEISENQMIPSGGYCKLTCSNEDVEELKNVIVCDDLKISKEAEKFKNLTYEQSNMPFLNGEPCPWNNLGKFYKELSASRWNKKDLMVLDDGSRDGWKCY